MAARAEVYGPQGFNLGWNLGRIAGAGGVDHVHLHSLVELSRWEKDGAPIVKARGSNADNAIALADGLYRNAMNGIGQNLDLTKGT